MEEPTDISFYIGQDGVETLRALDVPLEEGDVVSINLANIDEQNPDEIISFLADTKSGKHYWIIVARAYSQLGKLDEAVQIIKSALGSDNFGNEDKKTLQSFLIWLHFKFAYLGINKSSNLVEAGTGIAELASKIQSDAQTSPVNSTSNLLSQAVLALYQGHDDDALQIFEKILKRDQNNTFALSGKAQVLLNKSKSYAMALKLFQQVLILNPTTKPDPRLGIGLCCWFLKDEKMAIQAWERALELDPSNVKARIFLNLAHFHNAFNNSWSDEEFVNNYKACLVELSQIHKSNVNDTTVLLVLVSYYYSKNEFDTVERLLRKVVKDITGDENLTKLATHSKVSKYESNALSECGTWLGRIRFADGDFTQASKYFQEAIKLNDLNIVAKLGLGQSQYSRGSVEEATLTFESILRSNANCLEANYSLGVIYAKQSSKKKKELAIQVLERYIRLSNNRGLSSAKNDADFLLNKEPVALNAYLTLSSLYESIDLSQALLYLNKAVEARKSVDKDVPLEVYNNIGVFQFTKQNFKGALENFSLAIDKLDGAEFLSPDGDVLVDLPADLRVSLTFNSARTKELSDDKEALEAYHSLLSECPHYFSAKLRILFLSCISETNLTPREIQTEIDELLTLNASDLEIRSFYGWFAKNFGKKLGMKPDADTAFQKETLVEYDKHDCYALLSLANIYCVLARDLKGSSVDEKKRTYYVRATELYTKVLTVDRKNVYAAQGLAIVYIENKESTKGLNILRKIRDSLNDISVYLNLGHVLCDVKQYGKAIENYELALTRFTDGKDVKILTFLGRAWTLRGSNEQNLSYFKTALDYTRQAFDLTKGLKSALRFNISYIQFQIADFITKQPVQQRQPQDISDAITGLNEAIETLVQLSSDEEKHPPYPKDELRGRANLGSSTLLNRLTSALDETKENIAEVEHRLETAKQLREQEKEAELQKEQERINAMKEKEAELAKQRAALQEQAQQWAEESRIDVTANDEEENDDKLFEQELEGGDKKKGKGSSASRSKGKGGKSKKGKNARKIVSDSEEEPEAEFSENETKSNGKRQFVSDDDEDGDEETVSNGSKRKKTSHLSKEFIKDSDEELEDDDLFGNDDEEEKSEEEKGEEGKGDGDEAESEKE
ncbi:CTR9 [Candida margitis]|uniref:CTR9 n=1 Tax=Candida margitis TaxID=1775924 RepID=UPI0022273417|nr:CTR9 [Candida margitis]KAI5970734.1 CTR9 [Candida margitis]